MLVLTPPTTPEKERLDASAPNAPNCFKGQEKYGKSS